MRTVLPPDFRIADFFDSLISSYREDTLVPSIKSKKNRSEEDILYARSTFNCAKTILIRAEADFMSNMESHTKNVDQLGQYIKHNNIADKLSNDDYKALYDKFRGSATTSEFVEKLLNISNGKCIYCEKRHGNDELDHFLPKSEYDYLTITPANLLPSCSKCNKKKSSIGQAYHPYFNDFVDVDFIICDIVIDTSDKNSYIDFSNGEEKLFMIPKYQLISEELIEDRELYRKVKETFECLELSKRYSEMMTEIIEEKMVLFKETLEISGVDTLVSIVRRLEKSEMEVYSNNSCILPFYKRFISLLENSELFLKAFKKVEK